MALVGVVAIGGTLSWTVPNGETYSTPFSQDIASGYKEAVANPYVIASGGTQEVTFNTAVTCLLVQGSSSTDKLRLATSETGVGTYTTEIDSQDASSDHLKLNTLIKKLTVKNAGASEVEVTIVALR